ncbi:MAG: cytochrome P450 [Pseudomonadota bacterium]
MVDLSADQTFAAGFPHEFFCELRERPGLYWHEPTAQTPDGEGFWVATRYADVAAIQRDHERFSSQTGGGLRERGGTALKDERAAGVSLNMTDEPRHRQMRALLAHGFTPRAVAALRADLARMLERMLDAIPEGAPFDVTGQFARELPLRGICLVLGVPEADQQQLMDWVDAGINEPSASILAREPLTQLRRYAEDFVAERQARRGTDIFSEVVHARLAGGERLSDRELVAFFTLLFPAGAETTRSALGGALLAFAEHPESFAQLKAEPALRRSAVEEVVRWSSPSLYKRRTATVATTLAGTAIAAGEKVTLWEMSANRDRTVFDEPFRFAIDRWPNRHLGFGAGVHFCLGASLARLELDLALERLTARFKGVSLAAPVTWTPNNRLLGPRLLQLAFERA